MQLVEIYVIRAQPTKAVFRCLFDVSRPSAAPLFIHLHAKLGGDHNSRAMADQGTTEELLADTAAAIDVGRIEEVDAGIKCRMHHARSGSLVEPAAKVVAAEADNRYIERSYFACVHALKIAPRAHLV